MDNRPVVIVADSTLDVPAAVAADLGIQVVPLNVQFGDETFLDQVEMSSAEFLDRLTTGPHLPKTSQPAPARFEEVFQKALDAGNDVFCVTIASGLSGTHNSARLAADAVDPARVHVMDSLSVSIAGGFIAVTAARMARDGASLDEIASACAAMPGRTVLYAALDTLDFLHKGGRIGRASAMVGSLLSIKPIVQIRDGQVHPVERVRTWRKAMDRLTALAVERAPFEHIGVMHVGNPVDAARLVERIRAAAPGTEVLTGELGPVVATYGGPGLVGFIAVAQL